jgi:hypothetical protein
MTKYQYDQDKDTLLEEKKPYDSAAIVESAKSNNVNITKIERGKELIVETDKDLSSAEQDALKEILRKYDIRISKNASDDPDPKQ